MDVQKLTDRLNAPVQGMGADGLKLALALLGERRAECPGAVPVLVCDDEIVIECVAEQAADAKAWLEGAMIEGMDAVINGTDEVTVLVEVEVRIVSSRGDGGSPYVQTRGLEELGRSGEVPAVLPGRVAMGSKPYGNGISSHKPCSSSRHCRRHGMFSTPFPQVNRLTCLSH